jgi:hypothetical protein
MKVWSILHCRHSCFGSAFNLCANAANGSSELNLDPKQIRSMRSRKFLRRGSEIIRAMCARKKRSLKQVAPRPQRVTSASRDDSAAYGDNRFPICNFKPNTVQ